MGRSRKLARKLLKRTAENRQSADEKQCNEDEKHTEKHQENGDLQQTGEHQQPGALTKTIIHCCNICQLTFTTTLSFERHMKRHEADKPHKCQHCDKKFVTKSGLDIHRRKHTGERPFKCDNCSKAFTTRSVLIMHMRGHTGEKPYECNICGARFTQSATRADHMRRHTGEEQYQCTNCPKKFVTRIGYRGHILVCQRKSKIECKICTKQFITNSLLIAHMITHSNERPFECGECGKKFKSKYSLALHLKFVHLKEKPYQCDICMKRYSAKKSLIMHTMTHTNIGRFQCEQCGRMFNSKRHVLRHQTSQNGCKRKYVFKPFFCKQCGAQFNSDAAVRKHKRRTPDCTKTHVRFLCDFCREDCKTYEGLVTHLLDHAEPGRKGYDNLLNRMTHGKKRVNPALIVKVYNSGKVSTPRDNIGAHINIDQRQATSVPTDHSQVVHNNTAVDHQRGNADYHKTAIDHHDRAVDHHKTAVDHHETGVDNHKTAVNVFSQDTCLTSETNFDNINTNDKLNKDEGRKYLGNTDAYCNLDSNHVNGIWGTCQDLGNNYISTRELQVRDKCDIEVIKHACVMQRSYPMITEAEEVGLKEEEETEDYNLESKHIDGIWGTCQNHCDDYYSTREHKVKEKCDIEVIKDACVMQRSYPMIKEAEEVSVKEENETVEKWVEEPEMQKTSDRQFLESTSLLIVNGITTIKREACHPAPHTSVPHY
nr:zinc finger protein 83-like [Procambarus clarkii]XP_045594613.1 zinc finger protein 83-like [Procambarus clarkii]